jgi:hypothetical protein
MAWAKVEAKGDVPAERHSTSIAACGSRVVLFGGTSTSVAWNEVHVLDTKTWTWTKEGASGVVPSARWGHTAHMLGNETMVVYGGQDVERGPLADIFLLDVGRMEWRRPQGISGSTPPARAYHASALLPQSQTLCVLGGEPVRDPALFSLDLRSFRWENSLARQGGATPDPRRKSVLCATAASSSSSSLIAFGGVHSVSHQYLDDTRIFSLAAGTWTEGRKSGAPPGPRGGHVAQILGDKMVVQGGIASKGVYPSEIHQLDLDQFSWFKKRGSGAVPPPRTHHCSTVIDQQTMLIFGGTVDTGSGITCFNDLYTFSLC